jgi:RAVE protein 1 C terminal
LSPYCIYEMVRCGNIDIAISSLDEISMEILCETKLSGLSGNEQLLVAKIKSLKFLEKFKSVENFVRAFDYAGQQMYVYLEFHDLSPVMFPISENFGIFGCLSQSHGPLLNRILASTGIIGKVLTWEMVKNYGLPIWLREAKLLEIAEMLYKVGISEYKQGGLPVIERISVWLIACNKQQLLASLFKQYGQVNGDVKSGKISEFFSLDFINSSENRSKGLKNGMELIKQKRYLLAASVFILINALDEFVDVCGRCLNDPLLAEAVLKCLTVDPHKHLSRAEKAKQLLLEREKTRFRGNVEFEAYQKWRERDWTGMMECIEKMDDAILPEYLVKSAKLLDHQFDFNSVDLEMGRLSEKWKSSKIYRRLSNLS